MSLADMPAYQSDLLSDAGQAIGCLYARNSVIIVVRSQFWV